MSVLPKTFVGFGFGAIQGGLFLYEAFRSGKFGRLVVAEVVPEVVAGVRREQGRFRINIATRTGIVVQEVTGVEILNRSEEHTSELQSLRHLVCRLLLEKKEVYFTR